MTIAMTIFSRKKLLLVIGFALSILLVALYIFQLNYVTTLAYHIASHDEQLTQLKYDNAELQATTFQALSLKNLQALAEQKHFKKIEKVTFLKTQPSSVAQQ